MHQLIWYQASTESMKYLFCTIPKSTLRVIVCRGTWRVPVWVYRAGAGGKKCPPSTSLNSTRQVPEVLSTRLVLLVEVPVGYFWAYVPGRYPWFVPGRYKQGKSARRVPEDKYPSGTFRSQVPGKYISLLCVAGY